MSMADKYPGSAEEFLLEEGIVEHPSSLRQEVIGCIGCLWIKDEEKGNNLPRFHELQIVRCTGLSSDTVHSLLSQLEQGRVIVAEQPGTSTAETQDPPRQYYRPDQSSEVGQEFLARLRIPEECPLDVFEQLDAQVLNELDW
jgi:hypothetical protein